MKLSVGNIIKIEASLIRTHLRGEYSEFHVRDLIFYDETSEQITITISSKDIEALDLKNIEEERL